MVKVIDADLFDCEEDIICHQVNCRGVMGSGVALQVKRRYVKAFDEYIEFCNGKTFDEMLGYVQFVDVGAKVIANVFSQADYGGGLQTNYDAFKKGLLRIREYALSESKSIAMPYLIGCYRGGGDWSIVYDLITNILSDLNVTLYRKQEMW